MVEKLVLPTTYEKSYESLRTFVQKYPTSACRWFDHTAWWFDGFRERRSVWLSRCRQKLDRHIVAGRFLGGAAAFVVNLGGGDVFVAEQFLHLANVNPGVE